jgi:hypothetical protein
MAQIILTCSGNSSRDSRPHTALLTFDSEQSGHPIFTMPMLNGRVYVVTSPPIISLVQRAAKTLPFEPIVVQLTDRIATMDPGTSAIIARNYDSRIKEEQENCLLFKMHDFHIGELGPGGLLEELSFAQLNHMAHMSRDIVDGEQVELFAWIRHMLSASNMLAAYGPKNAFVGHPEVEEDFWTQEADLPLLMLNFFPSLIARKAYLARERASKAFVEWAERGDYKLASHWIQERFRINTSCGLSIRQAAQSEMGMVFGILANAMPSTYWLLANLIARPELLAEVREELEKDGLVRVDGESRIIKISALKTSCPLLSSIFRETLRTYAPMASARYVLEDTVIGDEYFLRKGSIVQMAGGAIHSDDRIWGSDVNQFNPRRFLYSTNGSVVAEDGKTKPVHPSAFRGFGGGTSLCPGRHFAQLEIIGFSAMMLLGFDFIVPGEKMVLPKKKPMMAPISVLKPDRDVMVRLQRRSGLEHVQWSFES